LLEALAALAPPAAAGSFRGGQRAQAVRFARACYDHLAGCVGVALTKALVARGRLKRRRDDFALTPAGERLLVRLGVGVAGPRTGRRVFARACLDWSERQPHLAGALGAALLKRLLALGWLERTAESRALRLRARGRDGLARHFGVALE